jgi:hypothetical protein
MNYSSGNHISLNATDEIALFTVTIHLYVFLSFPEKMLPITNTNSKRE